MGSLPFTIEDLLEYFINKNGSVIYTEIVTHFKSALSDPQTRDIARSVFKDHVNTLATVSTINGTKYLLLRDKFKKHLLPPNGPITCLQEPVTKQSNAHNNNEIHAKLLHSQPIQQPMHSQTQSQQCQQNSGQYSQNSANQVHNNNHIHNNNSEAIKANEKQQQQQAIHMTSDVPDDELMPPPPPRPLRHKASSCDERKKNQHIQQAVPQQSQPLLKSNDNKENVTPEPTPNENEVKKEIQELAMTAGRVKEHAQILNKLTSNGDFKLPMPSAVTSVVNKIRNGQPPGTDSDSGQFSITEKHKKWIVAAATCDYKEMNTMLKEDDSLASYCDFMNGFNALHWAAKFGRPDIVKLIAGKYQVDPNLKSFSGSTPLHLAATFRHSVIWELLVDVYGANKDVRDNSGKKPSFYLKKSDANKIEAKKESEDTSVAPSPKEEHPEKHEPKMNLRNKITYQSMLVRNKFRKSKSFQRRKSVAKS